MWKSSSPQNLLLPTTASTQSLRWQPVQQVTRGDHSVRSEVRGLHWARETQTVHRAWAPLGSLHRVSSILGERAWANCFCWVSVGLKRLESVCRSVRVQPHRGEVHRSSVYWFGPRRLPGGWGGESSPLCSPLRTWTENGWLLLHTHWIRLCIYPERRGLCLQQLEKKRKMHKYRQTDK